MRELDFAAALAQERGWQPDLAPRQLIDESFPCDDGAEYADYLKGVTQAGLEDPYADLITASKWRHGRRPIHIMPIRERVYYRSIVDLLVNDLPSYKRSGEDFTSFEEGPIHAEKVEFVVKVDIANYFSSIDHELITREIVSRSGRREVSQVLSGFWRSLFGRGVGIPQMSEPSKRLGELLVDNLHRSMVRRGFQVWRYADDFRIGAGSHLECIQALDAMHEESRNLGLSLNDWKTHVLSLGRYAELLNEPLAEENAARSAVIENLTAWDPYSDDNDDDDELNIPGEDEVYVGAAIQLLADYASEEGDAILEHSGLRERHKLVRKSVDILEFFQEEAGLPYVSDVLIREPQLTPSVCRYMNSVAVRNPVGVRETAAEIIRSAPTNRWQQLWIAWMLQAPSLELKSSDASSAALSGFLTGLLSDRSEFVRSVTLWTCARHRILSKEQWTAADENTRSLGAPYVAAALAGVDGISDSHRARFARTSKIDILAGNWGVRCIQ
nr:RNA-directed DNA polymerase [Kitasatospora fiedleri]